MPVNERDWARDPEEPFQHPFEPEPPPPRWIRWAYIAALLVAFVAVFWPPVLGIVLALWLVVYLLTALARSMHP